MVKIIRKWADKSNKYMFGTDAQGALYCRDVVEAVNLVLVDAYFKKGKNWYYKFVYPNSDRIKLVLKNNKI
jgi:hypothetical protein